MRRLPKRDLQSERRRRRHSSRGRDNALVLAPRSVSASATASYRPGAAELSPDIAAQQQTESGLDIGFQPGPEDGFVLDMFDDQQLMLLNDFDLDMNLNLNLNLSMNMNMGYSWMEIVPLTEEQMIRWQVNASQDITWSIERRQALESALSVAGRVLGSMEQSQGMETETGVERHIPSLELLYWMLNGMNTFLYLSM